MTDLATSDAEIETAAAAPADKPDPFVTNLSKIYQRLKYSKKLKTAMKGVEKDLLNLLGGETLYHLSKC